MNVLAAQQGVAIPGQIGQPVLPPAKGQPKAKNPMLTKVSRSDPALLQYARQTFGTLDLSEEQWKKAEDHYKVNFNIKSSFFSQSFDPYIFVKVNFS